MSNKLTAMNNFPGHPPGDFGLSLGALRNSVRGDVVVEGDADWNVARQAWNLAADQRPAVVALPQSVEDVVNIVRFARSRGLRIAPQGSGHNAVPLGSLGDTVLLRTSRMGGLEIDPENGTTRAEAGVNWAEIIPAAAKHGLAAAAGTTDDIGVVGYSLGGGIGWLARRFGTAAESIIAVELVTADGSHLRVDADHFPDLFWALRGGGGSFGVVTAIEFALYPVRRVYAGGVYWPAERAYEILSAWSDWTETLPDEMTSIARLLNLPRLSDVPTGARGRQMVGVEAAFLGTQADGERFVSRWRDLDPDIDTFSAMPASLLGAVHMDPREPIPSVSDGSLLKEFPSFAAEALVITAGKTFTPPLLSVEVRHLGGALARPRPEDGAFSLADAKFSLYATGRVWNPETREKVQLDAQRVVMALNPWSAGRSTLNFTERAIDPAKLFPMATYERLRAVKARYDKGDMFRGNHPIPPE